MNSLYTVSSRIQIFTVVGSGFFFSVVRFICSYRLGCWDPIQRGPGSRSRSPGSSRQDAKNTSVQYVQYSDCKRSKILTMNKKVNIYTDSKVMKTTSLYCDILVEQFTEFTWQDKAWVAAF